MALTAKPGQYVTGSVAPLDRKGNPAVVDGVIYTSSNTAVAEVLQDPEDKLKFRINTIGVGTAQIDVIVDAQLGEGERNISGFIAVEVQPEEAVNLGFTFSEPQDIEPQGEGEAAAQ